GDKAPKAVLAHDVVNVDVPQREVLPGSAERSGPPGHGVGTGNLRAVRRFATAPEPSGTVRNRPGPPRCAMSRTIPTSPRLPRIRGKVGRRGSRPPRGRSGHPARAGKLWNRRAHPGLERGPRS